MKTSALALLIAASCLQAQAPVVIQPTDKVSDSRQTINSNFALLSGQVSGLSNQAGIASANYAFTPQSPSPPQTLSPGSNTITLKPVPAGVNGSDIAHYLYISGGTGTAEACLITGGSAVSGSVSGTVTVSCANSHSGAWTISSATAGIQEAALSLPSAGGAVILPNATVNLYATLTIARSTGVCLLGQGKRSTILNWAGASSGAILDFNGPVSPGGVGLNHCASGFQILDGIGGNTNTALVSDNQAGLLLTDVTAVTTKDGFVFTGAVSQSNALVRLNTYNTTGDGLRIDTSLVGGTFTDFNAICSGGASVGIHVLNDQGSFFNGGYTTGCSTSLLINPTSSTGVKLEQFTNTYFDCGVGTGISINPAGGSLAANLRFLNTSTACSPLDGVYIGSTGTVRFIDFEGHTSALNGHNGFNVNGGTYVNLLNCWVYGNSAATANTWDAVAAAGVNNLKIVGGHLSLVDPSFSFQRYGVSMTSSVVTPMIQDVDLYGNLTNAILDNATTTSKLIDADFGVPVPTVASATAFDPTTADPRYVYVTGTTTVTSITRAWDQRNLTVFKTDSGSLTFMGVTLAQFGRADCWFSAGFNFWSCK